MEFKVKEIRAPDLQAGFSLQYCPVLPLNGAQRFSSTLRMM